MENWDLESLDLCRQHVQALEDAACSAKMSRMRRNPPGQALGRETPFQMAMLRLLWWLEGGTAVAHEERWTDIIQG